MNAIRADRTFLLLLVPAIYLFILPFPHTIALRSIAFGVSVLLLLTVWRRALSRPLPLKAAFAAWFALAAISLIWAIRPDFSLDQIRTEIVYGFIAFLLFFKLTKGDRELNLWVWTIAISALTAGILAIAHFARGINPYDVGLYGGTLHYAAFLNTIFPMLAAAAILRPGWRRIALVGLMIFLLATAYGTTSRAVWIGFLAELAVFGGLYLRRIETRPSVRKIVVTASVIIFVCLAAALVYVTKEKMKVAGGPIEVVEHAIRADLRPKLWADSIAFIQERPFTGAGFGRMVLSQELTAQQNDRNHTHAHNILLNYALQLGLLGPVVLVFLVYSVLRQLWKLLVSPNRNIKILGISGIATVGGIFVQCMIEDVFVLHMALEFWALLGITLGYAAHASNVDSRPIVGRELADQ